MSSSDKAKSKLLDSMRMSKQGSTSSVSDADVPETKKVEPAKKAAIKPANKPASAAKKAKKPAAKSSTAKSADVKKPVVDNFQAAQRVWPD